MKNCLARKDQELADLHAEQKRLHMVKKESTKARWEWKTIENQWKLVIFGSFSPVSRLFAPFFGTFKVTLKAKSGSGAVGEHAE